MIIGLDIGSSAVKIVGYKKGEVLFSYAQVGRSDDMATLVRSVVEKYGFDIGSIRKLAITGVGAEKCEINLNGIPTVIIPEIEATGEGGTWLSDRKDAVVVSLGTGTSVVLAKAGVYSHVGGSGVGSGTVRGLAKKMTGITDMPEYFGLAETGDYSLIDIQIRDLFSGTDTLPLDLTASNLAKCSDSGTDADWAAAIINMVLEVAGSHAALACDGFGVSTVIITGGLSQTKIAEACYAKFDRLYKQEYIIPRHSGCATAIGAARRAEHYVG